MECFNKNVESVSARLLVPYLWAFIDADGRSTGVPENFVYDTILYIIFTASPKRDRWKTLKKCTRCAEIVMNTWSLEEISQA
jgi:hypothetical protein